MTRLENISRGDAAYDVASRFRRHTESSVALNHGTIVAPPPPRTDSTGSGCTTRSIPSLRDPPFPFRFEGRDENPPRKIRGGGEQGAEGRGKKGKRKKKKRSTIARSTRPCSSVERASPADWFGARVTGKRNTGLWRYSKRRIYTSWTMKWCLVMLILAGVTRADNSVDADYSILKCPDLNSQEEIDLNEVSPPPLSLSLPIFAPLFPRLRNRGFLRSIRSIDASNREKYRNWDEFAVFRDISLSLRGRIDHAPPPFPFFNFPSSQSNASCNLWNVFSRRFF